MNALDTWAHTVPVIFMGLMGLAMFVYVVLDGFDLGIGLLLPLASDADKDTMISSIGHGPPARWTATMARVRGVSATRRVSAVTHWLSASTSATTGIAPHITAQLAEAT